LRYNNELYKLFPEPDIVKPLKIGRLQWAGHVIRTLDDNPIKSLTLLQPDGCRRFGRSMDGIEDDLRMLNVRGWRRRAKDRREWKNVLETAMLKLGCRAVSNSSSSTGAALRCASSCEVEVVLSE
jgi:hypothetical protein